MNPRVLVFGEDVGRKGGVHLVTEGLQRKFGDKRVFDTSLSEEGHHRAGVGMAISGLMPVAEIQFRKYADPADRAVEQLRHAAVAHEQPVCRADRGAHARRIRQGRGRPVAFAERRGALCARVRLAGGDAVERGRRGGAAARGDARRESDDLLRAPLAADDQRRQRALSRRRLRAAVRARECVAHRQRHHGRHVGRDGAPLRRGRFTVRRARGGAHRPAHRRAVGSRVRARVGEEDRALP